MTKDAVPHVWLVVLATLGVLNVTVAAAYYVGIVGVIYFRLPLGTFRAEDGRAARSAELASSAR